jgi:hypothetical protein
MMQLTAGVILSVTFLSVIMLCVIMPSVKALCNVTLYVPIP